MSIQRRPPRGVKLKKGQRPKWVVRYRDPAGKEHSKTFDRQDDAKDFDADQATKLAHGTWQSPTTLKVTVGEIFDGWMHSTPRRQATMDLYDNTRRIQLPPIADYPASKLTAKDVTDWYRALTTHRHWLSKADTGLSPATARDQLRRLRSAYRWAIDQGIVVRSPVTIPKADDNEALDPVTIPTLEEIMRVVTLMRTGGATYTERKRPGRPETTYRMRPDPTTADMMLTAALTGMRINELCGLVVADVDQGAGVIHLTRQLDVRTRQRGPLKTRAGRRDIPVSPELAPILHRMAHGKAPTDWLFSGGRGQSLRSSRLAVSVKRVAASAGAERVHFHALRHFFASSLITAGRPIHEVSVVMGHSSAAMTLNVYTHVLDRSGAGMRDAISAAIGSGISCCGISAGSRHLKVVPDTGS